MKTPLAYCDIVISEENMPPIFFKIVNKLKNKIEKKVEWLESERENFLLEKTRVGQVLVSKLPFSTFHYFVIHINDCMLSSLFNEP